MLYDLFIYENRIDLMFVDNVIRNCTRLDNEPMNKRLIKVHKGVDNQIDFRIMNRDRKAVSVDHLTLNARLVSAENRERVLDRTCSLSSTKGDARLWISEGDLVNIAPGFYDLVVVGQEALVPQLTVGENFATPFYTDGTGEIVAKVEVLASADPTPVPTVVFETTDWYSVSDRNGPRTYYSSAIPGERVKNHLNAVHTFSVYTTGFTGTVQVKASLELRPPSNPNDYFPVDITTGTNYIEFTNYTGLTAHTFEANFMWLIISYVPDADNTGTVEKVMIR
jgi:hypothetical protein